MLSYLIGILSGDIEVEVSPDYFRLTRRGQETNFRTVIYISADRNPRVLGVGDENIPIEPSIRIDLFKPDDFNVGFFDKAEVLEAFFRHCIRKAVTRRAMIRPRVVFRNAASLSGTLCGYQRLVLKHIATSAGARECSFQE
jgi:hypothetical protein